MTAHPYYTTEKRIREQAEREFLARRQVLLDSEHPELMKRAERDLNPELLTDPRFGEWISGLMERKRRDKLLLTERQYADLAVGRVLEEGDRAVYVGPTRMEPSPKTGRNITRPHGQRGEIIKVEKKANGFTIFTFLQDIAKETRDAAEVGLDVEVLALQTAEWTELERVPAE